MPVSDTDRDVWMVMKNHDRLRRALNTSTVMQLNQSMIELEDTASLIDMVSFGADRTR